MSWLTTGLQEAISSVRKASLWRLSVALYWFLRSDSELMLQTRESARSWSRGWIRAILHRRNTSSDSHFFDSCRQKCRRVAKGNPSPSLRQRLDLPPVSKLYIYNSRQGRRRAASRPWLVPKRWASWHPVSDSLLFIILLFNLLSRDIVINLKIKA